MKRWLLIVLLCVGCSAAGIPAESVTPTEPPFYAPDFTLTTLDGDTITLSDLRGKWVLINFWATYCVPCVEEMPALQQLAERYTDELVLLAINQREDETLVRTFLQTHDLQLTVLLNPDDATLINYQVIGLPQTLLITPSGEVDYRQFGPIDLATFGDYLSVRLSSS